MILAKPKEQRSRAYSRDPLVQAAYDYVRAVRRARSSRRWKSHPTLIAYYDDEARKARFALCQAVTG